MKKFAVTLVIIATGLLTSGCITTQSETIKTETACNYDGCYTTTSTSTATK